MTDWRIGSSAREAAALLDQHHYLGPLRSADLTIIGEADRRPVAAMLWKHPTARNLPADGSWLELARWCLTPDAGDNAGSRMHAAAVKLIRKHHPEVTTLVSYSDPAEGHTGALYRACNWQWCPTWHRLRPPPTGNGVWSKDGKRQGVKDRWVFAVAADPVRADRLRVGDAAAVRRWRADASDVQLRWAARSLAGDLVESLSA
jgi:hypothetical protein